MNYILTYPSTRIPNIYNIIINDNSFINFLNKENLNEISLKIKININNLNMWKTGKS